MRGSEARIHLFWPNLTEENAQAIGELVHQIEGLEIVMKTGANESDPDETDYDSR